MPLWVAVVCSFLSRSGIPWSEYTSACLPVLLMGDLGHLDFLFYAMEESVSTLLDCCEDEFL